jgi:flagellar basal-body rod protein FlgG
MGQIELVRFVNPSGLEARGGNLFAETPRSGEPQFLEVGRDAVIQQGYLESSNVDVAEELIAMITAQRAYELNAKAIQAADEAMQVAVNLKR